ncbi:hypothetical protein Poly41_13560 [Novipirellula artificiosorum]|uniref:Uncharacterized protein n=1 Tax=Novipirellula artificiosorum TaxID=2528016 RepID=A0A5C6DT83_9BACT|nr:hypothetical protein Poly41_13560 [Novipirellula artificiosorum]
MRLSAEKMEATKASMERNVVSFFLKQRESGLSVGEVHSDPT